MISVDPQCAGALPGMPRAVSDVNVSPSLAARFLVSSKGLARPPRKGNAMALLSQ